MRGMYYTKEGKSINKCMSFVHLDSFNYRPGLKDNPFTFSIKIEKTRASIYGFFNCDILTDCNVVPNMTWCFDCTAAEDYNLNAIKETEA